MSIDTEQHPESPADPELTVRLPHSIWMAALESLGQRPYAEVAATIETIAEQLAPQIRAASERAQSMETRPN